MIDNIVNLNKKFQLEFSLSLSTSSDNETLDDDTTTNKYEDGKEKVYSQYLCL